MYVTTDTINEMIDKYGRPKKKTFQFQVAEKEFNRIRSSQKNRRKHDITLYILKDRHIIVIAKPFYPPGMYRAPSGGLMPGEPFEEGAQREAFEETGCQIALERFLLRTEVKFVGQSGVIDWSSFVFQARYVSGDFQFTDHREIREVRLAELDDFKNFARVMRSLNIGGLHYRAALHEAVEPRLPPHLRE